MIALALGSGVLFIDYEFSLAPGAEKRKLGQPRLWQNLGFGRLPALRTKEEPFAVYLHLPASFASICICRIFTGTDSGSSGTSTSVVAHLTIRKRSDLLDTQRENGFEPPF